MDPAASQRCLMVVLESTWEDLDRENPGVFQVLEPRKGGREARPRVGSRQRSTHRTWKDCGLCSKSHRKPMKGWDQVSKTQICIFFLIT